MKNIVLLGSTGSIGESTIRVVKSLPGELRVVGLAANRDYGRVLEQSAELGVEHVAISDRAQAVKCSEEAHSSVHVYSGPEGVTALAAMDDVDVVLCAVVGMAGLQPVLAAIERGYDVALATKEVLVAAGNIVTAAAAASGSKLLPVDSEHSAIFQCLGGCAATGESHHAVRRLVLTASGGPFIDRHDVDFDSVSVEEALAHPRWDMGRKISIDSATLMNKGLEILEAHWMFDVPLDKIEVIMHPESIVHSFVEFVDGSMLAQLGVTDMRLTIQYALTYPARVDGGLPGLDLAELGALHFRMPDESRFPCLSMAIEAGRRGGTMPTVLNAVNEVAVENFLEKRISFSGIWALVRKMMDEHQVVDEPSLGDIVAADEWSRRKALEQLGVVSRAD